MSCPPKFDRLFPKPGAFRKRLQQGDLAIRAERWAPRIDAFLENAFSNHSWDEIMYSLLYLKQEFFSDTGFLILPEGFAPPRRWARQKD
jgi:hypothetical protein